MLASTLMARRVARIVAETHPTYTQLWPLFCRRAPQDWGAEFPQLRPRDFTTQLEPSSWEAALGYGNGTSSGNEGLIGNIAYMSFSFLRDQPVEVKETLRDVTTPLEPQFSGFDPETTQLFHNADAASLSFFGTVAENCSNGNLPAPSTLGEPDCGNQGSVTARIQSCAKSKVTSKGVKWSLVSRHTGSDRINEVWQDTKTGLVWGDEVPGRYLQKQIAKIDPSHCDQMSPSDSDYFSGHSEIIQTCQVLEETLCTSSDAAGSKAGIAERHFGVPTFQDWLNASHDGASEILPHLRAFDSRYLSLSTAWVKGYEQYTAAVVFDPMKFGGGYELTSTSNDYPVKVRCVGR
jgi:hypothetical protein